MTTPSDIKRIRRRSARRRRRRRRWRRARRRARRRRRRRGTLHKTDIPMTSIYTRGGGKGKQ